MTGAVAAGEPLVGIGMVPVDALPEPGNPELEAGGGIVAVGPLAGGLEPEGAAAGGWLLVAGGGIVAVGPLPEGLEPEGAAGGGWLLVAGGGDEPGKPGAGLELEVPDGGAAGGLAEVDGDDPGGDDADEDDPGGDDPDGGAAGGDDADGEAPGGDDPGGDDPGGLAEFGGAELWPEFDGLALVGSPGPVAEAGGAGKAEAVSAFASAVGSDEVEAGFGASAEDAGCPASLLAAEAAGSLLAVSPFAVSSWAAAVPEAGSADSVALVSAAGFVGASAAGGGSGAGADATATGALPACAARGSESGSGAPPPPQPAHNKHAPVVARRANIVNEGFIGSRSFRGRAEVEHASSAGGVRFDEFPSRLKPLL